MAIKCGDVASIRRFLERNIKSLPYVYRDLARHGQADAVNELSVDFELNFIRASSIAADALDAGHIDVVTLLADQYPWDLWDMIMIYNLLPFHFFDGRWNIVEYVMERSSFSDYEWTNTIGCKAALAIRDRKHAVLSACMNRLRGHSLDIVLYRSITGPRMNTIPDGFYVIAAHCNNVDAMRLLDACHYHSADGALVISVKENSPDAFDYLLNTHDRIGVERAYVEALVLERHEMVAALTPYSVRRDILKAMNRLAALGRRQQIDEQVLILETKFSYEPLVNVDAVDFVSAATTSGHFDLACYLAERLRAADGRFSFDKIVMDSICAGQPGVVAKLLQHRTL